MVQGKEAVKKKGWRSMSVYDWEDVGGDMAEHEAMLEEASEICEENDENCVGCPIANRCPF